MDIDADAPGYAIFETALGWFGLAWSRTGIVSCRLPGEERGALEQRLRASLGEPCERGRLPAVETMIHAYAEGERVDFTAVAVDLSAIDDPFRLAIYGVIRNLPYGETLTYGELAACAGFPGEAREVGRAMGSNPVPLIIPCHRVVAAGGKSGGFSAPGGAASKLRMLALERAQPRDGLQGSFAF